MDAFLELEKYKKFLDEGVISENEFRRVKQKILGLKTDEEKELEQQREDALEEIRRSRLKEDDKEPPSEEEELLTREQDNLERLRQLQYEKTFSTSYFITFIPADCTRQSKTSCNDGRPHGTPTEQLR